MATEAKPDTPAREGQDAGRGAPGPEPSDYAVINAVYATALAGLVIATRGRDDDPIRAGELVPMGAATFALSKVIAREKIGTWVREPFVEDAQTAPRPVGGGLRRALGELVTCTRCVGAWSALGIVGLRAASPRAGRLVTAALATSAANDFYQAAFKLVCEKANEVSRRT
jgi:hypothetical protein